MRFRRYARTLELVLVPCRHPDHFRGVRRSLRVPVYHIAGPFKCSLFTSTMHALSPSVFPMSSEDEAPNNDSIQLQDENARLHIENRKLSNLVTDKAPPISRWQLKQHLPPNLHIAHGGGISKATFTNWCEAIEHFAFLAGLDDAGTVDVAWRTLSPEALGYFHRMLRDYDVELSAETRNFGDLNWVTMKEKLEGMYAGEVDLTKYWKGGGSYEVGC